MSEEPPVAPTPAERRLEELMGLLAAERPAAGPEFAHTVVRRARMQRALATPLRTVGTFMAALGEGLRGVLGVMGGRRS